MLCILGTHNISNWVLNEHVLRRLRLINVHFDYKPKNISSDADLAVLTMEKEVEFQRNIRPICLWQDSNVNIENIVGQSGIVVGWGKSKFDSDLTEVPRRVVMPIVKMSDCYSSSISFFSILSNRTFCAGKIL